MTDFPKYPTDFVAMMQPFEDEHIERLLQQDIGKVSQTIDMLKKREVNATIALQNIKKVIRKTIDLKKAELEKAGDDQIGFLVNILSEDITNLESIL